ncbi:hypothetical protein [Streptomyces rishiriensis]
MPRHGSGSASASSTMAVQAVIWSPLAMGLLTGRYRKNAPPCNARMQ